MDASTHNATNISAALGFISPDIDRDSWAKIAMALKSELGPDGFEIFDSWSRNGATYNAADARDTWRSINGTGGVGIGSLFHAAREAGYRPERQETPCPNRATLSWSRSPTGKLHRNRA